jgi:serine/threonine-protein kinase
VALVPGTRLGAYEVLSLIGSGGMGEVYRARDSRLNRDVAVKVLPADVTADQDRLARFEREAQVLASLNHTNIANIYGVDDSSGTPALVMELVDGPTLADRIGKGPIPLDEALPIAKQIAEALEAAHEQGIIHRDLKPANIKLRPDGAVKVLDFGLAKAFDPVSSVAGNATMSPTLSIHATQAGLIMGTAAYMAPEQVRGGIVDRRADIWAFGVVLYEMLVGRRLFEGDTVSDTLASVLREPIPVESLPADTAQSVRRLLRRCLERDQKRRLHDIADARLELDDHSDSSQFAGVQPAVALSPPSLRARALPVLIVATLSVLFGGYLVWQLKPEPERQITRFTIPSPDTQPFPASSRQLLALSPDGTKLAIYSNLRLYLRSLSGREAVAIPGSDLGASLANLTFSPDGQTLAFWSPADGTLKRIAVTGGTPVTICEAANPFGMNWDPSGIVFAERDGVHRVSPNGGTPELIAAVGRDQMASSPQMLPGGRTVLFSIKKNSDLWDRGQIVVQSLPGNSRKTLVDNGSDGRYLPTGHLVYAVSGVLFAAPFDVKQLRLLSGSVPVVEGVRRTTGSTAFGQAASAVVSISRNGTLAYLPGPARLAESGDFDLALFDRAGGMRRLNFPAGNYRAPRASPDGKSVAFESDDGRETSVWVYRLDGSSAMRRLTFGGNNRAHIWSFDGQWIDFQSDREGDLAIFRQRADSSGTAERLTKPEAGSSHTPQSWSPDGQELLLTIQKGQQFTLWTMSMKDRHLTRFGDVQSAMPTEASFSPNGRWVAYQMRETSTSPRQILVQPFPASGAKYLASATTFGHPYWSRKGDELIMNALPTRSVVVGVKTSAAVLSFGMLAEFPRKARLEPNPDTGRRGADAMPDGSVIGVTSTRDVSEGVSQINVVLNWFEELKARVPTK